MATVAAPAEQRLLLYGVDWQTYTRLLRAFGVRPAVRLTYDRGALEIMTLSHEHESLVHFLGRLVVALTEELRLPIKGGRSTTFRRRRRQRGLEADESYWIASEPAVRGKDQIDLRTDPPPDLALEVDVSRSSLNRLAIYASLGVPEIWRLEGRAVVCYLLGPGGRYVTSAVSRAFPRLSVADLAPFVLARGSTDENALIRQFRVWVQQRHAGSGPAPAAP
jgi:Uma2 family endonuclease